MENLETVVMLSYEEMNEEEMKSIVGGTLEPQYMQEVPERDGWKIPD